VILCTPFNEVIALDPTTAFGSAGGRGVRAVPRLARPRKLAKAAVVQ
jgi:hypothetical protein